MLRQYDYYGSISSISGDCKKIVLRNHQDESIPPTQVNGYYLKEYLDKVEFQDAEERYFPHRFVYNSILVLEEIHVLNQQGTDVKIIVGGCGKGGVPYFEIFGPKELINDDNPQQISPEENHRYYEWRSKWLEENW